METIVMKDVSYKEFKEWCNERACDGRWSFQDAIVSSQIIDRVERIKIRGIFKRKQTMEAREKEFRKIVG